jgi:hypothetical protein
MIRCLNSAYANPAKTLNQIQKPISSAEIQITKFITTFSIVDRPVEGAKPAICGLRQI